MLISAQRETIQEVPQWIYQNQLSRRNLTDEKRTYLIGKQYEHRKNRVGENQYTIKRLPQNEEASCVIPTDDKRTYLIGKQYEEHPKRKPTAVQVAEENNVSKATVERAEQYAKSVDNIAKTLGNETKEKILSGELKTAQNAIGRDNFTNRYEHLNHVVKTSP